MKALKWFPAPIGLLCMMRKSSLTIGTVIVSVALVLAGCGSAGQNQSKPSSGTSQSGAAEHNQDDVTFAQELVPHHQLAVQNCDIILGKQGIDPRVVDLANQIKGEQTSQIQQLQAWLNQWGNPAPSQSGMPSTTAANANSAEIDDLQKAQGVDDSKMFLTEMISHDQAGITVAQTEIKSGQFPAAIAMANDIVNAQQQQITQMQKVLSSL